MAYVSGTSYKTYDGASSTTIDIDLPAHAINDLLIVFTQWQASGTVSETASSGWAELHTLDPNSKISTWWKVAASSSETSPQFTLTASGDRCAVAVVVKGAPSSSPIDTTVTATFTEDLDITSAYSKTLQTAITTTSDDVLCLIGIAGNNSLSTAHVENAKPEGLIAISSETLSVSSLYYPDTGTQTASTVYCSDFNVSNIAISHVCIKNDTGGRIKGKLDASTSPTTVLTVWDGSSGGQDISNASAGIIADLDGDTTTFEGITHVEFKTLVRYAASSLHWSAGLTLNETSDAEVSEVSDTVTTFDLSSSLITCTMNTGGFDGWKSYANGGQYVGLSNTSRTGATYFKLAASDTQVRTGTGAVPFVFNTGSSDGRFTDGTNDLTDVDQVFLGGNKNNTSSFTCGPLHKLNTAVMTYGNSSYPTNMLDFAELLENMAINTVQTQKGLSTSQFFVLQNLQVGNGLDFTYWKSSNQAIEFPAAYSEADLNVAIRIPQSGIGLTVYAADGDTIDFSNTTINFGDFHTFTIHASSSDTDIYSFDGCTILNAVPTIRGSNIDYSGITFNGCTEVIHNGASLSGATITAVASGEAAAVRITATDQSDLTTKAAAFGSPNMTNNTNAPALLIEYSGTAGAVSVDLSSVSFSGNTTDIRFESVNNCDLTVQHVQAGLSVSASTDSTIAVVTPATEVRVTVRDAVDQSLIQGAVVYLKAASGGPLSAGTEILNDTTGVSGVVEDTNFNYTSDQPVIGWVRKASSSPLYNETPLSGTITTNGYEQTAQMISDEG